MRHFQRTVKDKVVINGKGLHSGRLVHLEILPAEANTGIIFHRTDSHNAVPVSAHPLNVSSTTLSTTLGVGASAVSTVEHLMGAFSGLGIDNAYVKLDGPELPILDGSAIVFVRKLLETGIKKLNKYKKIFRLKEKLEIRNGDQFIKIVPSKNLKINCSIEFNSKVIGFQSYEFKGGFSDFVPVSTARTFCHLNDVNAMKARGLALGGTLDNAVVITDDDVLNEEGLRGQDEFVRHKLLDLVGDFYLIGSPIVGEITAHKAGHALHTQMVAELVKYFDKYLIVEPHSVKDSSRGADIELFNSVLSPNLAFG